MLTRDAKGVSIWKEETIHHWRTGRWPPWGLMRSSKGVVTVHSRPAGLSLMGYVRTGTHRAVGWRCTGVEFLFMETGLAARLLERGRAVDKVSGLFGSLPGRRINMGCHSSSAAIYIITIIAMVLEIK